MLFPFTKVQGLASLNNAYEEACWEKGYAAGDLHNAIYWREHFNIINWRMYIEKTLQHLINFADYISTEGWGVDEDYLILEYLNYYTGEVTEVDMTAILDAMEKAEPHQPLLFIGYLEAYYAATWNATFDETAMAELVRKWAIWG